MSASDSQHQGSRSRRGFLRTLPTSLTLGTIGSVQSATANEGTEYEWVNDGDYIERTFDEDTLLEWVPFLNISSDARRKFIGLYGFTARSPDHDTDAHCFWARYTHQESAADDMGFWDEAAGWMSSDSHLWDHEPSTIFTDSQTGEFRKAIATGYHHYPLEISAMNAPLTQFYGTRDSHLHLNVVDPWHHYTVDHNEQGQDPTYFGRFESFIANRDSWEEQNIFKNSNPLAIDNPWALADGRADSWWDESTRDARAARIWAYLGLRGAGDVDSSVLPALY
ncbi:hypothetical protein [Natronosalvus amylolyticus]|uniref:hypothetical protein n=1 Tax=Natronosalvus amylolyticus TaxID=2961994 RepID=UPI0020C96E5D|nr:hypothetical protein [Natronosalvus amylolyticus]